MKKLLNAIVMLGFSAFSLHAQTKTIKGRVINDHLETLPFVIIKMNDTLKVGKTDLDGFFEIEIPVSTKQISFETIGADLAYIKLEDACNEVDVVMTSTGTYDFTTLKKVDRLRMKKFKQLPELHKKAFEKGIFRTSKACYIQDFIPHYKKQSDV